MNMINMLEARRKTRKRIIIIGFSSIVLVGVIFAAIFGIVNATQNNSQGDNDDAHHNHSVTNSVKAVCDVTLYKDSCYSSLGSVVDSRQVQPEELFKLSMKVALSEVSKAVEYFNDHEIFKGLNDSSTKEALTNFQELLGLAVDHLNSSLTSEDNSSLLEEIGRAHV